MSVVTGMSGSVVTDMTGIVTVIIRRRHHLHRRVIVVTGAGMIHRLRHHLHRRAIVMTGTEIIRRRHLHHLRRVDAEKYFFSYGSSTSVEEFLIVNCPIQNHCAI
ncbi:MAG: hypothetical protein IJT57_01410 [Selenomonadaceae bacterium]|nr:hypothetical protein [Selenomonadaceae bacterium]